MTLASCRRGPTRPTTTPQQPVEQRVADLEQFVNSGAPPRSEQELRKEAEHDLAEIRSLGLVERAQSDFSNRVPGAVIEDFQVSYFRDTNVVWCSVSYKAQGGGDTRAQDFGYKRAGGTNWNLIWPDESKK